MGKLLRRLDTQENRDYWEFVDRTCHEASKLPRFGRSPNHCKADCRFCAEEKKNLEQLVRGGSSDIREAFTRWREGGPLSSFYEDIEKIVRVIVEEARKLP